MQQGSPFKQLILLNPGGHEIPGGVYVQVWVVPSGNVVSGGQQAFGS